MEIRLNALLVPGLGGLDFKLTGALQSLNPGYIFHGKRHVSKHMFRTNQETVYVQGDYMCFTIKYMKSPPLSSLAQSCCNRFVSKLFGQVVTSLTFPSSLLQAVNKLSSSASITY